MPVERRSSSNQIVSVVVGVVAVALAGLAAWGLITLASGNGSGKGVSVRLGDDVFNAGQSARLSKQIASDGPVLFSDVSGRGQRKPIYVNHFGTDPGIRWVAFPAVAPGAPTGCYLAWSAKRNLFEERQLAAAAGREQGELCRKLTFAANGETLEQYPWRVDTGGNLLVDLRPEDRRTSSTTAAN